MKMTDHPWRVQVPGFQILVVVALVGGILGMRGTRPPSAPTPPPFDSPLVFDGITVIDVEHGARLPNQRVVIVGNHIQAMGRRETIPIPSRARVIKAQGQYLIPGLWDMHSHTFAYKQQNLVEAGVVFPMLIATGVTGFRDAGSGIPIDTLRRWQREILAGKRVGPPRMILSGQSLGNERVALPCVRSTPEYRRASQTCVVDSADVRHLVDSLKTAGANMIKLRALSRAMYFVGAAEARRLGIPFGGHIDHETPIEASDSGAVIVDHSSGMGDACWGVHATVAACRPVGEHFQHSGTWLVATLMANDSGKRYFPILQAYQAGLDAWRAGTPLQGNWLRDSVHTDTFSTLKTLRVMHDAGVPFLAGTDANGFHAIGAIEGELALEVAEGLTPLEALQTATLNPAKFLHATDSLGTVTPGKLADLVILDGDPLTDIGNLGSIRAVVANGRYYDRATLMKFLVDGSTLFAKTMKAVNDEN